MERYIVIGVAVIGLAALATPVAIFFGLRGRTDKTPGPPSAQAPAAAPAPAPAPPRPAPAVVPTAPPPVPRPAQAPASSHSHPSQEGTAPSRPSGRDGTTAPPAANALPEGGRDARPPASTAPEPPRPAPVVAVPVREAVRPSREMEAPIVPVVKPSGKRWVFKGRVYDLINLSPVYDAKLSFMDPSGREAASTVTKDEGMFEVSLDALPKGGYTLAVHHMDYRTKYIDDINPPFDQIDDKMRRPLADAAPVNKPWIGSSDKATKRDFVMVPKVIE